MNDTKPGSYASRMQNVLLTVRRVEAFLNRAVADYEASLDADAQEFFLLKIQALIFLYDVITTMVSIGRNNPKGFAQAVALKPLVHSLYEYDQQISRTLVPQIIQYAARRKKPIDTSVIKAEKKKWREQLAKLKAWQAVRNAATGHYDEDIEHQVRLLKAIGQEEVLSVASAFLEYNGFILELLPHRKRSNARRPNR